MQGTGDDCNLQDLTHLSVLLLVHFQTLLPRGCCHVINYSLKYEDTWRCNFLGLHPSTPLPPHADLYVTVTLNEPATEVAETTPTDRTDDLFQGYKFSVETSSNLPASGKCGLTGFGCLLGSNLCSPPCCWLCRLMSLVGTSIKCVTHNE